MTETSNSTIIIGAGLSGLTAAYYLKKNDGITPLILEGRDTVGGRIQSSESIDLGAAWLGDKHRNLLALIDDLSIDTFPQYQKGNGIFINSAADPPQFFDAAENSSTTLRITGGSGQLIKMLADLSKAKIKLNERVVEIREYDNSLKVVTDTGSFAARKIIVTVPLPLGAENIQFTPPLPTEIKNKMRATQTWMSNAIKIGLRYDRPFWRENNLSGTLIAPNSPVIELYDHSSADGKSFALMGFANEGLREHSRETRRALILEFLASHFGKQVNDYLSYVEKDWRRDRFTAASSAKSIYMRPDYGDECWKDSYMNDRLLFACSETSAAFGGYMEGAVTAGIRAARKTSTKNS
jgi:monoamine oxidase